MFDATVTIPSWVFSLLLLAGAYAALVSILLPGVRWFLRRRLNRAVERLNARLSITIKPFQQTRRQELIEKLVFDPEVMRVIEEQSQASGTPREVLQQQVKRYAREIVPSFNAYVYFQVGYWMAKRLSRALYRVRVSAADPAVLQSLDEDSTVVFVMNHRSNMDYVLISYLAAEQVTLSYAVGEWARVFPLESIIRAMGAFFIRRGYHNPLYRKVLGRYVQMATESGVCQAVYLEGGLSRDGRLGKPRLGFLDYMLRHYDYRRDRNITFVPVGINYDRVIEDENLIHWDNRKQRQSTSQNLRQGMRFLRHNLFVGSRRRWRMHGYAGVNFGIPINMRDYCEQHGLVFDELPNRQRLPELGRVAELLMQQVSHVIPILPVPLVAMVFMQHGDKGLRSLDVLALCDESIERLMRAGAPMTDVQKPRQRTLARALESLCERGLLAEQDDFYQIIPQRRQLLAYYANSLAQWQGADENEAVSEGG